MKDRERERAYGVVGPGLDVGPQVLEDVQQGLNGRLAPLCRGPVCVVRNDRKWVERAQN
jgi:hypothetical protein